jgi:hypothetical protein
MKTPARADRCFPPLNIAKIAGKGKKKKLSALEPAKKNFGVYNAKIPDFEQSLTLVQTNTDSAAEVNRFRAFRWSARGPTRHKPQQPRRARASRGRTIAPKGAN